MVWFLVDDNLALHRKASDAGNAAMGLWVRSGAWSAGNLTDGYIPAPIAHRFGTRSQIDSLLSSGLWSRCDGGYQFHDWTDRQPTAEQVRQRRDSARKRKAKQRGKADVTPGVTANTHARGRPSPVRDLGSLPHQGSGSAGPDRPTPPDRAKQKNRADPFVEIADCEICDDDGRMPNGMPCDHVDRTESHRNGMAAATEALNEAKARKANRREPP